MYRIGCVLITLLLAINFSGCSFFYLFQGSFDAQDWEIEKIVLNDGTYLGLSGLRQEARAKLEDLDTYSNQQDSDQKENTKEDEAEESQEADGGEKDHKESIGDLEELSRSQDVSTWSFDAKQNRIYGVAACNQFSADYVWKDADRINIYNPMFTRRLCSLPKTMIFELRLSQNLVGTYFVQKQGKNAMILKSDKMQIYLKKHENNQPKN